MLTSLFINFSLQESDIDFNRFDLLTNDACWYLKTQNAKSRNSWLRALKYQMVCYLSLMLHVFWLIKFN